MLSSKLAYRLNFSVIAEHDFVFVVDVAELLLGNVDSGAGDEEDLEGEIMMS